METIYNSEISLLLMQWLRWILNQNTIWNAQSSLVCKGLILDENIPPDNLPKLYFWYWESVRLGFISEDHIPMEVFTAS